MKITAKQAALILPLFFFIGILVTMMTGYWKTESSKQPAKYATGALAGENDPGDIRGSYSLEDLENAFGIPVDTLAKAFGLSEVENPAAAQIKILEEVFGELDGMEVGTDSVRLFIALYLDRPHTPEPTTALPQPAYNILKKEGASSEEQLAVYAGRIVSLDGVRISEINSEESHDEESEEMLVKGKTTFADLLDWGLESGQIEEALGGLRMGTRAMTVRDYCSEQGIEFSEVKTKLQEMLDRN